jgi:hypothetical protein
MHALMLRRNVMERNERGAVRNGMAAGIWLGVALGIAMLTSPESDADDLDVVVLGSNSGEPAAVEHTNGDAPPEVEVADAVEMTPEEPETAGPQPVIRFKNANPRVNYGGIIERRMGTKRPYRERIRHHGVYSSQHAQPDIEGEIRFSGVTR